MRLAETQKTIHRIADLLQQRQWLMSTCESCTGGLVAKMLTDLPGSSAWFVGGLVTYSNAAKSKLANVSATLIDRDGAVSESVAEAMALGCNDCLASDVAVSITGIAGPGGGSATKPVGTVCFAWALPTGVSHSTEHFEGNRQQVREQSLHYLLQQLLQQLK